MGSFYILLTVLFTVYGQLIIKQQVNRIGNFPQGLDLIPFAIKMIITRPLILTGFISAMFASIAWIGAMSKYELSYALPLYELKFPGCGD